MAHAETVLGRASDTIQSFRELLVQAGNGANTASDLGTITSQLVTLRNQLLSYANTTDANGQALFGGLGSTATPFVEPNATAGVVFAGLGGQSRGTDLTIPNHRRPGRLRQHQRRRLCHHAQRHQHRRCQRQRRHHQHPDLAQCAGRRQLPDQLHLGHHLHHHRPVGQPAHHLGLANHDGQHGDLWRRDQQRPADDDHRHPAAGDSFTAKPKASIFDVMDSAIAGIKNASSGTSAQASVSGSLALDNAYVSVQAARGLAGDYLNQADVIDTNQQSKAVQLESDRSRAEDLDMLQGISDFQNQTTGYQAALKSYAQIQSMSLFDFLK
jgi:flagellar hook-associated protein 3 FlgL